VRAEPCCANASSKFFSNNPIYWPEREQSKSFAIQSACAHTAGDVYKLVVGDRKFDLTTTTSSTSFIVTSSWQLSWQV
jgi:hypothetical protein